ncbi:response regulator [Acuticoccus sp. I52.16.1]|uniref:response regulator n=1 Tax=Acuticoccus sp. I52.16.1 TaxID=2928472 RepID=UPI001FD2E673|nr:response regulator [Acuticoccus sp. I52.16.1]UOM32927.1 response regulator [Acuticoccus sp. I52.16.1]
MAQVEIMIVEDEAMISFDLADLLQTAGYQVNGPHATASEALEAMADAQLNLAILDVDLGDGQTSDPVAQRLAATGTPFMFVSGYTFAGSEILQRYPDVHHISKPWDPQDLLRVVARTVGPRLVSDTQPA